MTGHHFISYSSVDGQDFALRLSDALEAGPPHIPTWIDQRKLQTGPDWDRQIVDAIRDCDSLIFVMTRDSVEDESVCKNEWVLALKYKKPVIAARFQREAELPFRLGSRQFVDFTGNFDQGLARLHRDLQELSSPRGVLQAMKYRLADAQRDLRRAADDVERGRIQEDIEQLMKQIAEQQRAVEQPQAVVQQTERSIQAGLERERQPEKPIAGETRTKFINPPPVVAPAYFQDRHVEIRLIGDFLKDESKRLMAVVGRAGIGKSAMVCRLLKGLESGQLPDDGGPLPVDGIVYLSEIGSRRVNVPHLYADLCQLLPEAAEHELDALYKNPQVSTEAKMRALLAAFPRGRVVLLLDNFENTLDPETDKIKDAELDEALRALLTAPHHAVNVILTTRVAPRDLLLVEPGRHMSLELDAGLESPYAENILREMDADGKLGLKAAPPELLNEARIRTRGYPRALEALVAILSADRYTTLEEILADAERLLPENVVEALVGQAFDRLDASARRAMQALAVYNRPVTPAAVDYLLQPYWPGVNSAPVLNRLVNMQFARREAGRYYLHPVDRAYAFGRIPKGEDTDRPKYSSLSRLLESFMQQPDVTLSRELESAAASTGSPRYTQYALLHRGAEYFRQARTPREQWKNLNDLAPQLAEFDLRCEGEDYDTAASVLRDIDFDYLLLWGHYRLMAEMHERLQGKIDDLALKQRSVGNLGTAYSNMGQFQRAITCYEQALAVARELKSRQDEGAWLGNLGNCYADLGQTARAIEYFEQALAIDREIGDRRGEGNGLGSLGLCYAGLGQTARAIEYYEQGLAISREIGDRRGEDAHLGNLGSCYSQLGQTARAIEYYEQALTIDREIGDRRGESADLGGLGNGYAELGQTARAIEYYEQALVIAREIGDRRGESVDLGNLAEVLTDEGHYTEATQYARDSVKIGDEISSPGLSNYYNGYLALAYLYADDLLNGRAAVETARRSDEPQNNHYIRALLGVIALRQVDRTAAREAFAAAVAHADSLLVHTAQNYSALDAKALALCGLALCGDKSHLPEAVEAYRAAREINKDKGIAGRVLRLLDALAVVDRDGVLAEARRAAAGGE